MALTNVDQDIIWHPYTHQASAPPPLAVTSADGVFLNLENGEKIIDAISSWWVNLHGHGNPAIVKAISRQAKKLDHTLFAGFTHKPAVQLAQRIIKILPANQKKAFYSDNGSTAVEVALKMTIQYWANKGKKRSRIIALQGAYHGDTFGAMSVGERSVFTDAFQDFLFDVDFLEVPLGDRREKAFEQMKELVAHDDVAAFIFEPLVQGAGGMRMYRPEDLDYLIALAKTYEIPCIADEVMTGFGRTGKLFACNYLRNKPDIMCLSKGITGGVLPLAMTTCTNKIYKAFTSDDKTHTLYHGHSYTANPIACAAGLASLDILLKKETSRNIKRISKAHEAFAATLSKEKLVRRVDTRGTILAIELSSPDGTSYNSRIRDQVYQIALENGVLLRPLGNIIYVLPPYVINDKELKKVYKAIGKILASLAD